MEGLWLPLRMWGMPSWNPRSEIECADVRRVLPKSSHYRTTRSRVFLEKLTSPQLSKKYPAFYGTWRSITAFTNARHLSLTWASWIQSIPPHHSFSRSILILSSHLRLGLPSGLLYSVCPTKTVYKPLLYSHTYYMTRPSHSSQFDHPINIGRGVQIIKLIIMQFSPLPLPRPSLRLTYSPQHLVLIHPQPMFLAQYRRPSFTPIQNNRKIFQYRNTDQNNTSN